MLAPSLEIERLDDVSDISGSSSLLKVVAVCRALSRIKTNYVLVDLFSSLQL
jgi:hypothetical protein